MKLRHTIKYFIMRISDDFKEIIVEKKVAAGDYASFIAELPKVPTADCALLRLTCDADPVARALTLTSSVS